MSTTARGGGSPSLGGRGKIALGSADPSEKKSFYPKKVCKVGGAPRKAVKGGRGKFLVSVKGRRSREGAPVYGKKGKKSDQPG